MWTRHELIAAYWVGRVLGADGAEPAVAHESYLSLPLGGRVGLGELRAAEARLATTGLTSVVDGRIVPDKRLAEVCRLNEQQGCELLLALTLDVERPLWLMTATGDGATLRPELLPDEVRAVVNAVIEDPARREAFLLARARKVDADDRARIGAIGEIAVVAACQQQLEAAGAPGLAANVRRVSLISDELGYDVTAPRLDGTSRRVEVKTTRAAGALIPVVLTRTEATVGISDSSWYLLIVRLDGDEQGRIVGWIDGEQIGPLLPVDQHSEARWETARLRLPAAVVTTGLPAC